MNAQAIPRQPCQCAIKAVLALLLAAVLLGLPALPARAATTLTVQVQKDGQTATVASYTAEALAALGTVQQNIFLRGRHRRADNDCSQGRAHRHTLHRFGHTAGRRR